MYNAKLDGIEVKNFTRKNTCIIDWKESFSLVDLYTFLDDNYTNKFIIINNFKYVDRTIDRKMAFSINFTNINFTGSFLIRGCTFEKEIRLWRNKFLGEFEFYLNIVEDRFIFNNNYFKSLFYINDNQINNFILGNINIIGTKDVPLVNSSQILNYAKNIIKTKKIDNIIFFRKTCNFIQNTYVEQKNNIDSNIFYALEMLTRSKELELNKTWVDFILFKLNYFTSNHGQSIGKPFILIILLAMFWGSIDTFKLSCFVYNPDLNSCLQFVLNLFKLNCFVFNPDYFIGIALPVTEIIKFEDIAMPNGITKIFYVSGKVFSAVLWWQLIRAIRKDIKR